MALFISLSCQYANAESSFEASSPFKISATFDGSYNYLQQSNQFTSGTNNQIFDLNESGLTLQQFAMTVSYLPEHGVGYLINGMLGREAITSNAYGMGYVFNHSQNIRVDLTQAYTRYSQNNDVYFDWGKFATLNGGAIHCSIRQ